ncbi:MAG: acetylornithine/succinylornithine family transaminase [Planctomycetes bacterium]|nr:acetylornithine/succinylornithine family transaminase [Planctomycetota bacterium]
MTQSAPPSDWVERAERVLAPTYARPARVFVSGEGSTLVDEDGRRYLDMTSGVAVNALGHGSPVVADALRDAADGLIHTSNLFHTRPAARLAELLVEHSFADRVFFCNSGAESVEGAIKFAIVHGGPQRKKVVAFRGSFHGRTLGALSSTDMPAHHSTFGQATHRTFAPFNDDAAIQEVDESTCAVIVEPIQGEGGVRSADPAWLGRLRQRCSEVGALLIFDEVQTGLGRTGKLWAHEWYDVTPDIMTVAKPLAGGLPMGAVLMTEAVAASLRPGLHATTFGGGPLVASVGARVVEHIAAGEFLADVRAKASFLREQLGALRPHVAEVRGKGLLVGLRLSLPGVEHPAKAVVSTAFDLGLLLVAARDDVVRLIPALNVTREELETAVERLALTLERVASER